jgi:DNA polymerase V
MTPARCLALVDCNNFYVSCEQAFNPALRQRVVVVLSNNDGCVVSRSAEAKLAGIPMGVPYFKIKAQLKQLNGVALSSNYALYADMSQRAMSLMRDMAENQEIYSIDECFLDFSGLSLDQAMVQSAKIRQTLWQCLSLPVCIGLGATKTLAKLANEMAKTLKEPSGICNLGGPSEQLSPWRERQMEDMPVSSVWGIGRRTAQSLEALGIHTVGQLLRTPPQRLRKYYSVNLFRTLAELNGQPCIGFEQQAPARQQIIASRSFGHAVEKEEDLHEALATFATRAAERLREDGSLASHLQVYVRGNPFAEQEDRPDDAILVRLDSPTDDTRRLVDAALSGLKHIYRPGCRYKKAGVVLGGIVPLEHYQPDLLTAKPHQHAVSLMQVMDQVNARFGRDALRVASMGFRKKADWHMSCSRRSRRYTTALEELPVFSSLGMA